MRFGGREVRPVFTCKRVPRGSVGDAVIERRRSCFARHSLVHRRMVPGVGQSQVFEHVVVGRQRRRRGVALEHCNTGTTCQFGIVISVQTKVFQ